MVTRKTTSTQWTSAPDTDEAEGVYVRLDHDGDYDLWCRGDYMSVGNIEDLRLLHEAISAALED